MPNLDELIRRKQSANSGPTQNTIPKVSGIQDEESRVQKNTDDDVIIRPKAPTGPKPQTAPPPQTPSNVPEAGSRSVSHKSVQHITATVSSAAGTKEIPLTKFPELPAEDLSQEKHVSNVTLELEAKRSKNYQSIAIRIFISRPAKLGSEMAMLEKLYRSMQTFIEAKVDEYEKML